MLQLTLALWIGCDDAPPTETAAAPDWDTPVATSGPVAGPLVHSSSS